MTELRLTQQFEQLFEPAARAARRGDADQIRKVLESVRSIWKSFRKRTKVDAEEELARGMTFAIEGILGTVLASAGADARHALLEGRKYALPVLHALGKKARSSANDPTTPDGSMRMGELAKAVGVLPQNIGELVDAMSDCGLVRSTNQGVARCVTITEIGAQMLEAAKPGWQLMNVDQDLVEERLEESFGRAMEQFQAMGQSQEPYCVNLVGYMDMHVGRSAFAKRSPIITTLKERFERFERQWHHAQFAYGRHPESEVVVPEPGGSDPDRAHELERLTRVGAMRRGLKSGGAP